MTSTESTKPPFGDPGIFQPPGPALATYRPEALMGMPMRYYEWERLRRAVRRSMIGDENWWKEFAVLFFGAAIGLILSIVIPSVGGTAPTNQMPTWLASAFFVVLGAVCAFAYRSTNVRDKLTASAILELMDDIETQFTKPANH